jgi:Cu(I)/Ag(I) efflux system protein CusF
MTRGIVFCLALAAAGQAFADAATPRRFAPNEGEVLQVDKDAREITIRHGYLPELDMDPMSMVFAVAEPALLDRVKKGDLVKFKPGLVDGRFAVLSIRRMPTARKPKEAHTQ